MANGGSSTLAMNGGELGGLSMKLPLEINNNPRANVSIPVRNQK